MSKFRFKINMRGRNYLVKFLIVCIEHVGLVS